VSCRFIELPDHLVLKGRVPRNVTMVDDKGVEYDNITQVLKSFEYKYISDENDKINPSFAITREGLMQNLRYKPFNFFDINNVDFMKMKFISFENLAGQSIITTYNFSQFDPKYFAGNRIYFEIDFEKKLDGMDEKRSDTFHEIHIDFLDLSEPDVPFNWRNLIIYITVPTGSTLLLVFFLLFSTYIMFFKKDKNDLY
jgi:hypothetical protein